MNGETGLLEKLEQKITELEETILILSSGSDNEALEELGARYKDASDENRKMRFAICSVLAISKNIKGEPGRQIRDILINVLEEINEETP